MTKSIYEDLEQRAGGKEEENWRFRSFLKFYDELSDEELDSLVFATADEVWSGIDCTECGRCCVQLHPVLSDADQGRLAERLKMSVEQLRRQYLTYDDADGEPGWRVKGSPCPFLEDKKCSVYEDRPDNCREYPYLHKAQFSYRTMGMIGRTFTCPIVYETMEELKAKLGFH